MILDKNQISPQYVPNIKFKQLVCYSLNMLIYRLHRITYLIQYLLLLVLLWGEKKFPVTLTYRLDPKLEIDLATKLAYLATVQGYT